MKTHFLELIRRAASVLPEDVRTALEQGRKAEGQSSAGSALDDVLSNCALAKESSRPLCQDTGTNIWYVYRPANISEAALKDAILFATREATKKSYLRPNAMDAITGKNSGDNTGIGFPVIHFHEWDKPFLHADLMLKGGGSENVSCQYSLPDSSINAGRDVEGIRRAVIDGVFKAQGQGCGPGVIGVGVGGDRATSMIEAKEQLFRTLDDQNPDEVLGDLEKRLYKDLNELGIGPMGFGGKTTVLGVKIGKLHRLPASFFVSIAYMCWACRRASVAVDGDKADFEVLSETGRRPRS